MNLLRKGYAAALVIALVTFEAQAKHICPRIPPIELSGIRFVVPNDQGFRGYVQAFDITTGKLLWEKTIYRVLWRLPFPELDLYYCVVLQMKAKGGKVLVQNDHEKWYMLDPQTRTVTRISASEAGEATIFPAINLLPNTEGRPVTVSPDARMNGHIDPADWNQIVALLARIPDTVLNVATPREVRWVIADFSEVTIAVAVTLQLDTVYFVKTSAYDWVIAAAVKNPEPQP